MRGKVSQTRLVFILCDKEMLPPDRGDAEAVLWGELSSIFAPFLI